MMTSGRIWQSSTEPPDRNLIWEKLDTQGKYIDLFILGPNGWEPSGDNSGSSGQKEPEIDPVYSADKPNIATKDYVAEKIGEVEIPQGFEPVELTTNSKPSPPGELGKIYHQPNGIIWAWSPTKNDYFQMNGLTNLSEYQKTVDSDAKYVNTTTTTSVIYGTDVDGKNTTYPYNNPISSTDAQSMIDSSMVEQRELRDANVGGSPSRAMLLRFILSPDPPIDPNMPDGAGWLQGTTFPNGEEVYINSYIKSANTWAPGTTPYIPSLGDIAKSGIDGKLYFYDSTKWVPLSNSSVDISSLFNLSYEISEFKAILTDTGEGKSVVELYGINRSGRTDDLVITFPIGSGSYYFYSEYNSPFLTGVDDTGTPGAYKVSIIPETDSNPSTTTIPYQVKNIRLSYFVGHITDPGMIADPDPPFVSFQSYITLVNGVRYNINAADNPITNFSTNVGQDGTVSFKSVDGTQYSVRKDEIKTFYMDQDYSDTSLPDYFLYYFASLEEFKIPPKIVNVGYNVLGGCSNLKTVWMPPFLNSPIEGLGWACFKLSNIYAGTFDASNIAVALRNQSWGGTYNLPTNVLHIASQELATAWKTHFPYFFTNWTIDITG
jgi:hypothetical protein